MMGRLAIVLLTFLIVGFGLTSSASANFITVGIDPAGDSTDPNPSRDIIKVAISYDRRSGNLKGGVVLGGTPASETAANLTLFAGRRTASGCNGFPAIGFGTQTDVRGADWVFLKSAGAKPIAGAATKTYDGAAEEYEATARQLAGQRPNCVIAQLNDPANSSVVYDVAGPYKLRGLPELEAKIVRVPPVMRLNQTQKIRVAVRNPGDAPTGRVRLTVGKARGMKVNMPRALASIRPGTRRTVTLRVTLNRRAKTSTALKVTAVAKNRLRASDEETLYLSKGSRKPANGGGGSESGSKLCFRYTWLPPYSTLVPC